MSESRPPYPDLRSFYDIQADYELDEDDTAYVARKTREAAEADERVADLPLLGIF